MTKEYKVITTPMGFEIITLLENGILHSVPKDPSNVDYQSYLRYINGEPEPTPGGNNQ